MKFTKLFSSLIYSTIWREDNTTRLVWITMLAIADYEGIVEASLPGLADAARVSIGECLDALEKLKSPDPYSRSQEHEGRRIEEMDGGWVILNYPKYRDLRGDRKTYYRQWRQEQTRELIQIAQQIAQQSATCATHKDKEEDYNNNNIQKNFDISRKLYPGVKRGYTTEFGNFIKRHKDWKQVSELLKPAIEKEIAHKKRLKADGKFCPEWPHFQTWINQRRWEQEFETSTAPKAPTYCVKCGYPKTSCRCTKEKD